MILTVTPNPALDHTLQLDTPLQDGVVSRTANAQFDAGGKGINVSQYLTALDVETVATGFLGGRFGEFVVDRLASDGVENDFVDVDDDTRVNTTILAPHAEYKVNQRGPRVPPTAVDALVDVVRRHDADTVVVSGSLPPGLGPAAVDRLADGPWRLAVDFEGPLLESLGCAPDLCKPNREELAAATGMPVGTVDECVAAAEALRADGFERVVASLGSDGAILVSERGATHVDALDVDVVDTVGAGDSLLAGVLAALEWGYPEDRALDVGVAVSARVVAARGTEVPDLSDLEGRQAGSIERD